MDRDRIKAVVISCLSAVLLLPRLLVREPDAITHVIPKIESHVAEELPDIIKPIHDERVKVDPEIKSHEGEIDPGLPHVTTPPRVPANQSELNNITANLPRGLTPVDDFNVYIDRETLKEYAQQGIYFLIEKDHLIAFRDTKKFQIIVIVPDDIGEIQNDFGIEYEDAKSLRDGVMNLPESKNIQWVSNTQELAKVCAKNDKHHVKNILVYNNNIPGRILGAKLSTFNYEALITCNSYTLVPGHFETTSEINFRSIFAGLTAAHNEPNLLDFFSKFSNAYNSDLDWSAHKRVVFCAFGGTSTIYVGYSIYEY